VGESKDKGEQPVIRPVVWRLSGAATAAVGLMFAVYAMLPGGWRDERKHLLLAHVTPPANLEGVVEEDDSSAEDELAVPDLRQVEIDLEEIGA
jgi:hypothetical protein